ncbi:polysaccharide deacetylase family protein [Paenibacillus sp. P96]|uniref:Polysaccharide deacetylase family protein n=1 Tax=Paenibacillus zeirhizosphaerae TaxID=2987519 RepID=A0ABT9FRY9_9BACL|nr:polysaccharide deacetylase family protein [Paenibacillus sp. P96]MDP4097491.1 polysaccharide deacetylase family protein [Paenibacillus sp. P96]
MKKAKIAAAAVVSAALVLFIGQVGGIRDYVQEVRNQGKGVAVLDVLGPAPASDQLIEKIQMEADRRKQAPVDAKVDPVWKAIPGYNGLEVDIDATYLKAAASPDAPVQYIHKQISPRVSLDDLGNYPIYRGNPSKPMAAIMINVAWGNEYIVPMLDTLDREHVKATFFLDGSWLKKNSDLAKEIQKRGHEISNHAYSHPHMSQLSRERATQEISKTEALLKETLGVRNKWFAPPSGDYDQGTVEIAAGLGLKTILWTLDTVDWKKPEPLSIVRKIEADVEPGSLILMHPTRSSALALADMIKAVRSKGLVLGTVSQTLSPERIIEGAVE